MRFAVLALSVLGLLAGRPAALAKEPVFDLPVACAIGAVCVIQNYVDHDPGTGRMDYACGRLSYDGHDGTDIRIADIPTMQKGVPVIAAAPGIIKAMRDGMPDVSVNKISQGALLGRDAGNGVVIDHGDGWETQYSHLRQGSVVVKQGQAVKAGDRLGLIGLSGNTEFPHVEFTVRHNGKSIDPFVGEVPFSACGDARRPLWSVAALAELEYRASGPLAAGFATERPEPEAAREGAYRASHLPLDAAALVMWVDIFGAMAGDVQRFRLTSPDGTIIHESEDILKESNVSWFAFSGRKRPPEGWKPGAYRSTYTLTRGGEVIVNVKKEVVLG